MTNTGPKKVLFLITKSNFGGAQRYVYDLATTLDPERFEVVVALGGNGPLATLLEHAGIRTIPLPSLMRDVSIKNELRFIRDLWQIIQTERPAILHVNSSKAGAIGTLLGRISFTPRVLFTAHGWAFNEDRPWWQKIIIKLIHAATVLFSHRTIAVSHAITKELNWPVVKNKFKVINPGRNIGVMYSRTDARNELTTLCPTLAAKLTKPWLISIAELHPIKRLDVFIRAFADIVTTTDAVVVLIGEGQQRTQLEALISEYQLYDRVVLTGSIIEAARFLHAADVFVLPSKSESYGYVVMEAGLAHVPIIATRVGGIVDIVDDSTAILIPPDNQLALAHAITQILDDPLAASTRAERLAEKLKTRTVTAMTNATAALYELPLK